MKEFIYPLKKIFCLDDTPTKYYIGPYQRGYKWGSLSRYDQVPQLLIDIYGAFEKHIDYYLQYVTIKFDSKKQRYEVIDGQQRLTTLSLLFYILESYDLPNPAKKLVEYSRYDEDKNIFVETLEYISKYPEEDDGNITQQDFFYFVKAARVINKFSDILNKNRELQKFVDFLNNQVKIIVNTECEFIVPEEVFMQLNNNRVPLTDSYLIKGLLLTHAVNIKDANGNPFPYKEILDQRMVMGRIWDEINTWVNLPKIAHFFFRDYSSGMDGLLSMAIEIATDDFKSDNYLSHEVSHPNNTLNNFYSFFNGNGKQLDVSFLLFNKFNEYVKTDKDAFLLLDIIRHIYYRLHDIYENHEDSNLYNLLGFIQFSKTLNIEKIKSFKLKDIFSLPLEETESYLSELALLVIPEVEKLKGPNKDGVFYEKLRYKSSNDLLSNHLLSLNVFPEHRSNSYRFDFFQYDNEKWSFEHFSPQHPKSRIKIAKAAIQNVVDKIKKSDIEDDKKKILIEKIQNEEFIEPGDLSILYDENIDLDAMGNMALLGGGANSALKNNPYMAKRGILFEKMTQGYFIPIHTLNVFNKVLDTYDSKTHFSTELLEWTNDKDVKAHEEWMEKRNKEIRKILEEKIIVKK